MHGDIYFLLDACWVVLGVDTGKKGKRKSLLRRREFDEDLLLLSCVPSACSD